VHGCEAGYTATSTAVLTLSETADGNVVVVAGVYETWQRLGTTSAPQSGSYRARVAGKSGNPRELIVLDFSECVDDEFAIGQRDSRAA
jgi:hypothetical protein